MIPDDYHLTIRVTIERPHFNSERLSVDETVVVPVKSFLDIARILGQFHELATAVREGAEG